MPDWVVFVSFQGILNLSPSWATKEAIPDFVNSCGFDQKWNVQSNLVSEAEDGRVVWTHHKRVFVRAGVNHVRAYGPCDINSNRATV